MKERIKKMEDERVRGRLMQEEGRREGDGQGNAWDRQRETGKGKKDWNGFGKGGECESSMKNEMLTSHNQEKKMQN